MDMENNMMMENQPDMEMNQDNKSQKSGMQMSNKSMSNKQASEKQPSNKDMMEDMNNADENTGMMAAVAGGAAGEALGLNAFGGDDGSDNTVERKDVRTDCCCFLCNCSNELTENVKCCFCFPIKAGIYIVGLIIFFIALNQFMNAYFQFMNITVPWWKPTVTLVLFVPGFIGACFYIGWFTKDCTRTRGTLTAATIQGLTSYVLILTWQIVYFFAIEKKELVGMGFGDDIKTYSW